MLVVLCLALLSAPIWRLLRSGTRMSLQGMLQVETTQEARRIIRQVYTDLKQSCFQYEGKNRIELDFASTLEKVGDLPTQEYRFLAFPFPGKIGEAIPAGEKGYGWRRASRITYALEPVGKPGKPFLRLTRTERFHPDHPQAGRFPGGCFTRVLSERVHFFSISPASCQSGDQTLFYFWITLQLADSLEPRGLPAALSDGPLVRRPAGVIIADFAEVVYPEYFNAFLSRNGFNVNWYSGVVGP